MPKQRLQKAKQARNKLAGEGKPGVHRVRSKVKFYRPITKVKKRGARTLKNIQGHLKNTVKQDVDIQLNKVLLQPVISDKNMTGMEKRNTLTFIVNPLSNKATIRAAFKKRFGLTVKKVNTMHTPKGLKKAFIRLGNDAKALELASKIGII